MKHSYDLAEFELAVKQGYIRKVETKDLVLYNYTDKCTHERAWNKHTLAARGIIFEKATGELVAHPFPKFFNLGEQPETELRNLPDMPYRITEKMDGSLGIIYYYDNRWNMATRGSFSSPQAQKGLELLNKLKIQHLNTNCTYLVEIIYPGNKIVVNYGETESLSLLGIYKGEAEDSFTNLKQLAALVGFGCPANYFYSIQEMILKQQTLPKDQEGFVVRYSNGLRVKIKGKEYLRIHKLISNLSPLSCWEAMDQGVVNKSYLEQLPEEYRKDIEPIVESLEQQYKTVQTEIEFDIVWRVPKGTNKEVGIFLAAPNEVRHPIAVFPRLMGKTAALDRYIMKQIRPTGNLLKS